MVANHEGDSTHQIIGASFVGKKGEVQRKPSSVYWTGIRQFGLIRTDLSLQGFCQKFRQSRPALRDLVQGTDKRRAMTRMLKSNINETINTLAYDDNCIDSLTIHLSQDEASFLSRQIEARVPLSLIGQILLDSNLRRTFLDFRLNGTSPHSPMKLQFLNRLPDDLRESSLRPGISGN